MNGDNLDLSRLQCPLWDTERRPGDTHSPDSTRFFLLLNRTVFTPPKDALRPPPVLKTIGSQEASDASQRKRLSEQLYSRLRKPALFSPRKRMSPVAHATRRIKRDQVALVPTPASNVPPLGLEHQEWSSGTGKASTRREVCFQRAAPWPRAPATELGDR